MRNNLPLILALGLLGACTRVTVFGHTVKDGSVPATHSAAASPGAPIAVPNAPASPGAQPQISRITLEFTPAAQKQVADDERFNVETLREAIAAELRSRQLLDQNPGAARVAVIQVDEFAVRATSNVVVFGRLPSAGVLDAAIRIRTAAGGDVKEFHVRADIPLNIVRNGTDKNPLQKLYSGFARQFVDELTGAVPRQPQRP